MTPSTVLGRSNRVSTDVGGACMFAAASLRTNELLRHLQNVNRANSSMRR
jgi:hypothetical protein